MKAFQVACSTRFKDDYTYWQRRDKQKCLKIDDLIKNTIADPFKGIGKPEPLRHELAGCWSRRITREHRLVYQVKDNLITLLQCRHHYD